MWRIEILTAATKNWTMNRGDRILVKWSQLFNSNQLIFSPLIHCVLYGGISWSWWSYNLFTQGVLIEELIPIFIWFSCCAFSFTLNILIQFKFKAKTCYPYEYSLCSPVHTVVYKNKSINNLVQRIMTGETKTNSCDDDPDLITDKEHHESSNQHSWSSIFFGSMIKDSSDRNVLWSSLQTTVFPGRWSMWSQSLTIQCSPSSETSHLILKYIFVWSNPSLNLQSIQFCFRM